MEEEVVLCAASAYEQKFYLNPQFESLPEADVYKRQAFDTGRRTWSDRLHVCVFPFIGKKDQYERKNQRRMQMKL